jgi:putative photosynthetic complex assembly protein 2
MSEVAIPALIALLLWWFSTGIILYVVGLPPRTYRVSVALSAALGMLALLVLANGKQNTAWDATTAFTCALAVWGFVEMTFLTGYVTGSRKTPCPPDSKGWLRVRFAIEAIFYHELLLLLAGAAIFAATGGRARFALAVFAILWVMRLSSKLNLFLGVPMLNAELLPAQLGHLKSYFRRRSMNLLFPFSVAGSAVVTAVLIHRASSDGASEYSVAAYTLMATLLALGLLEHLFMLMPIPIAGLWGPQIKARYKQAEEDAERQLARNATPVVDLTAARAHNRRIRAIGGIQ